MPDVKTDPAAFRAWAIENAHALQLEGRDATDVARHRAALEIELIYLARTFLWADAMPGYGPLTEDHPDYAYYTSRAEDAVEWAIQQGTVMAGVE